jgi:hypothetical protein
MERPTIIYDSRGETGNIYYLIGQLQQIMRQQRRYTDFNNLRDRIFESGSYEEALAIIGEEVELVDIARE